MFKPAFPIAVTLAASAISGCGKKPVPPTPPPAPAVATLGIDLYLHPESASADDLILQTAIRGRIEADALTRGRVQVRVAGLKVVLSGSVSAQATKDATSRLAQEITVTIGDKSSTTPGRIIAAAALDDSLLKVQP